MNFNSTNKNDLKNKLIKEPNTSNEDVETIITPDKSKKNKSHKKKHRKNKKYEKEDSDSDEDDYDDVKSTNSSNISDSSDEEKEKKKRRKKKKKVTKKNDSTDSENSDDDSESREENKTKKRKKKKNKINNLKKKIKTIKEELEYKNLKNQIKELKMGKKENTNTEIIKNEIIKTEIITTTQKEEDIKVEDKKEEDKKEEEKEDQKKEDQKITEIESKYIDLPQKRKLSYYLLQNDFKIFNKYLPNIQKFSDEQFNQLFEGNTHYQNFNVPNQKDFIQLVGKFDDTKDLTSQWYNEENYYQFILPFWKKPLLLEELRDLKTKDEKYDLLKQKKIDFSKWDNNFLEYFEIIINKPSLKTYAQRMKNYIKADYGNFDELIKVVDKCGTNLEKDEKENSNSKITFKADIDTTINKLINQFVPSFITNLKQGYNKFEEDKKKKQEEIAKDKINEYINDYKNKNDINNLDLYMDDDDNSSIDYLEGLSDKNKKILTDEVKKMYNNENKKSENNENAEIEKINELSKNFNKEGEKFCQIGILDKSKMLFESEQIKSSILGLSITNCCYSYLHLGKTFFENSEKLNEFDNKFKEIEDNFKKHKNEVPLIDEDDIDNAIKQIIDLGKKFQEDLNDINKLINEINQKMKDQNNELNKTYLKLGASVAGMAISFFASTQVEKNNEYNISTGSNIVAIVGDITDIQLIKKYLNDFKEILDKANKLKSEIIQEIDKLRQKFEQLSSKHFS